MPDLNLSADVDSLMSCADLAAMKTFLEIVSPSPPGASNFVELADVPSSYSGAAEYFVKVNAGGTALEFVAAVAQVDRSKTIITQTTDQTIANETETVFNDVSIPAEWVVDGGTVKFRLVCTLTNVGSGTLTVLAKMGATTVINDATASLGSGTQVRHYTLTGTIDFTNFSGGNCTAHVSMSSELSATTTATTGTGDLGTAQAAHTSIGGSATVTAAANTTFFLSLLASANITLVIHSAKLIATQP